MACRPRRTLLAFGLVLACALASAAAADARPRQGLLGGAGCSGVHLLSDSLVVEGISDPILGTIVTSISGPLDDAVSCAPLRPRTRDAQGGGCENARTPAFRMRPRVAARAVRCLMNRERSKRGIPDLASQRNLKGSAAEHTHRMLSAGCFSHQCPGEPDLVARATAADYLPCRCTWMVAENLAWGVRGQSTPAAIVEAWMSSPGHRETLLLGKLRDVGVVVRGGRPGNRSAEGATYTANFGVRR